MSNSDPFSLSHTRADPSTRDNDVYRALERYVRRVSFLFFNFVPEAAHFRGVMVV